MKESPSPGFLFWSEGYGTGKAHNTGIRRTFSRFPSGRGGYSMPEVLVVIAVVAILAALGITAFSGVVNSAKEETATGNLSHLNRAVMSYSHAVSELTNAATSGITDEQSVFTALKTRDEGIPGTPFLNETFTLVSSSDTTIHRASWNGYTFVLLKPGTSGTGVDLTKLQ